MTGHEGASLPVYMIANMVMVNVTTNPPIDIDGALNCLCRPGEAVGLFKLERRFEGMVRLMGEEDTTFVLGAYRKWALPAQEGQICHAEAMALARVCRKIIREYQESKEQK